jgi:putative transposase
MRAYLSWVAEYGRKFGVEIHAWVLMTNHVHLLCTPRAPDGVSQMMQAIGRMYVRYFNFTYQRTGTLWEGRYKSCLVESESYLLHLYRYIELNPVRAGMVERPDDYTWSSYPCNALGKECELRTPHDLYLALGRTERERLKNYRELFSAHVEGPLLDEIRQSINKALALGHERFAKQLEELTGRRVTAGRRGRPKKGR